MRSLAHVCLLPLLLSFFLAACAGSTRGTGIDTTIAGKITVVDTLTPVESVQLEITLLNATQVPLATVSTVTDVNGDFDIAQTTEESVSALRIAVIAEQQALEVNIAQIPEDTVQVELGLSVTRDFDEVRVNEIITVNKDGETSRTRPRPQEVEPAEDIRPSSGSSQQNADHEGSGQSQGGSSTVSGEGAVWLR